MSEMTLGEAWAVLGRNAGEVLSELKSHPKAKRIELARDMLAEAKKTAKHLMAKHHPDKGGDPSKFIAVQKAVSILEFHTAEFESRMTEAIKRLEEKNRDRVVIKIDR